VGSWSFSAKVRPAIALALAAAFLLTVAGPARAEVEVPFAPRFATSVRGDLTLAANTLMTCPDVGGTEATCLGARNGIGGLAALNNNGYAMELVDVDGDPSTFDSSAATLTLPAGATVQFAGLFYGGRTSKGAGAGAAAAPAAAARGSVLLRAPGALGYTPLTAAVNDSSPTKGISNAYTGYVDVTPIVAAAGSGSYTVANVQAGTGEDRYAGWSLVVAYADPASAPHSIRVFEGLSAIGPSNPQLQIGVEGLETPSSGTVAATVGVVAYEGDRGSSGDRLSFAGHPISDLANPVNNVFNSSIASRGVDLGGRTPNYLNQLGFDADLLGADGVLANGATAALLEESTTLEQYLTQVVALSVELNPAVLESPPPPAPAATPAEPAPVPAAPAKHHEGGDDKGGNDDKGGKQDDEAQSQPAPLRIEVEPTAASAPPTAVVTYAVTVSAGAGESAPAATVCSQLPPGLERLAAPGAKLDGDTACWHLGRLAAHAKRRLTTTARVEATGATDLLATTTLRVAGKKTRRLHNRLRVQPLPLVPCGRVELRAGPVAQASC
jgi:hypothetical protein